jgi:hypothetical protein
MTYGLVSDNVYKKEDTMVETTTPEAIKAAVTCPLCGKTRAQHVDPNICPGPIGGWAARYAEAGLLVPEFLKHDPMTTVARSPLTVSLEDLEIWGADFLRQAEERAKKRATREPEVFSAGDELAAVKYAREQGFITKLEAQRKVRKLLRLKGKRTLAERPRRARRAR